jgi:4-carboxymuconolactone decarboxylase
MSRMPTLTPEEMDEDQRAVVAKITAGPRKGIHGPFLPLLHSPLLLDRVQELGLLCRFQSSFPPKISELLILISARFWTAQFEFSSHMESAKKAGVPEAAIEAIRTRKTPHFDDPDQALVYKFANEFFTTNKVSDETFNAAVERFGRRSVVDLVGIMGYYALIAMTLNIFEELPTDMELPLAP